VVSHDRYVLERVTDQQYAIIDGYFRHLPGGVDQYLRMETSPAPTPPRRGETGPAPAGPSGAELRAAQKEIAAIDRKLARLAERIEAAHEAMARHDQSDYQGLIQKTKELRALQDEVSDLETRWLELSEHVG
jgi:ATPase subunit of ABC transporter with duplicated ATPase domains